jgi:hypothetical protein
MNGQGILLWPDGREYRGEFRDDKREGFGVFKWKDGRTYRGHWINGKQHGIGYFKPANSDLE